MNSALFDLVAASPGALRAIDLHARVTAASGEHLLSGDDLFALRLTFSEASLWLLCVGETDEIVASPSAPPWPAAVVTSFSNGPLWSPYLDLELLSASILTNDRGYQHAVQLQFGGEHGSRPPPVQVEAAASRFRFLQLSAPDVVR